MTHLSKWQADAWLVIITFFWGTTFVVVKDAVAVAPPFYLLAIRFTLAAITALLIWRHALRQANRQSILVGAVLGSVLFLGYSLQTVGLQYTGAARSAFITGLSVIIVPLLEIVFYRRPPALPVLLGAAAALTGLGLMTLQRGFVPALGDVLVFFCAIAFAVHILLIGKFSPAHDARVLTAVQISVAAILSAIAAIPGAHPAITLKLATATVITGILATTLAFWVQTSVQKFTTPSHAALVFSLEPVFGALTAYVVGGEVLSARAMLGAGLILAGMLMAELVPSARADGSNRVPSAQGQA